MASILMFYGFFLVIYGLVIYGLTRFLGRVGVGKRVRVFTAFSVFGIGSGFFATLAGPSEIWYWFNILSVPMADQVYIWAAERWGDSQSAIRHFTVPWILRTPQVALFTSFAVWTLIGIPAQLIANLRRKPAGEVVPTRQLRAPLVVAAIIGLFLASGGLVFLLQSDRDRYGPSEPYAAPIAMGGLPAANQPPVKDPPGETWTLASLVVTPESAQAGHHVEVEAVIVNLNPTPSNINVEIKVDGKLLADNRIIVLPGENPRKLFLVVFPKPGVFTIEISNLSAQVEIVP